MSTNAAAVLPAASAEVSDSPGLRVAEALAFSFLIGLCAQIRIHLSFTPVPITGQTLAVLAGGVVLGPRFGALAVAFYLAEGALGLPFFAGGSSGAGHFFGPTAGYLIGFLPAAALTGALARRGWDRSPALSAAAMALGSLMVFACGLIGLSRFVEPSALLQAGFLPFLPGDAVKIALSAAAVPAWRKLADGIDRRP